MTGRGSVSRRCRCRDADGRDLGAKCPKLKTKGHARWQLRQELAAGADGKRRTFRRGGFDTKDDAQDALDEVRTLLAIARDDDEARKIGDLLSSLGLSDRLPEADTVAKKIRSGITLTDRSTVGDALRAWIKREERAGKIRRNTLVSYRGHVDNYLIPKLGHIERDRLTSDHVRDAFAEIVEDQERIRAQNDDRRAQLIEIKGAATRARKRELRAQLEAMPPFRRPAEANSRRRILATLRTALNDLGGKVFGNPAADVELPTTATRPMLWTPGRVEQWRLTGRKPNSVMVWLPEHAGAFLDHVAAVAPAEEPMWHVILYRGPRRGEVAGLPWADVDLTQMPGSFDINRQLVEVEWDLEEGLPKSEASARSVPLDKQGTTLLRQHRARQNAERLRLGPAWVESGKVFTRPDGSALRPSWITDRFAEHVAAAGLPPIRLHDCRHVAATLMLAAGYDLKVVSELLGHSMLSTTSDVYTSVLPQIASAAAEDAVALVPRRRPPGHPPGTQADLGPATASGEVIEIRENRS